MSTPPASFLRLHVEPPPASEPAIEEGVPGLSGLCRAFESATGWRLAVEPKSLLQSSREQVWAAPLENGRATIGQLCLSRTDSAKDAAPIDTASASRLAAAIGDLVNGRLATETALWQREAELASCVPVVTKADEAAQLAARLEAVLKAGADAIGCQAAGLYLLDADTTQLKLRSVWGLPHGRLLQSPRLLSAAMADLEALSGHAVVLEKAALAEVWSLPEPFPAAVCVPVSTPTVPLGTLWLFSDAERPFSDAEVNLAEVIAGRLAIELEREMLVAESQQSNQIKRQVARAHDLQENAAHRPAPLIDGWDVAGWAIQSQQLGGAHFDWQPTPEGALACAIGEAGGMGISAAMIARTLRAALAAHAEHEGQPHRLLERINQTMWRQSAGDQSAGLCLATLHPASKQIACSWAGSPGVLHVREQSYELYCTPSCPLGLEPDTSYLPREIKMEAGEVLLLCTPSLSRVLQQPGHRLNAATLGLLLMDHLGETASHLSELVRSCCESQALDLDQTDRGIVVLKAM